MIGRPNRIPGATYRLQLRKEFPLAAARAIIPYLRALGITDLYLSPLYTARPGSSHGYDVLDHAHLNPELGAAQDLGGLLDDAKAASMGVLIDTVPNHMCILGDENLWWREVLEDGAASEFAPYFDIDWDPPKTELAAKILLPFLGDQYGRVLESELAVSFRDGGFMVSWNGGQLPLAPETWGHVLQPALDTLRAAAGAEDPAALELESILRALTHALPALRQAGSESVVARRHEKQAIRRRLADLCESRPAVAEAVAAAVKSINGVRGQASSFDALERLMNDQVYRLADWRVAAHEINYRRFFEINDLAAVRVETPAVFEAVHALPLSLAKHEAFAGFRIDHLDGLADPQQYLDDLAAAWQRAREERSEPQARPYVVVEKILGVGERLPARFLADGTTGYDFIAFVAGLLTRAEGLPLLRASAQAMAGSPASYEELAAESKGLVLQTGLAAELTVLARRLDRISEQHRYTRDFTLNHLHSALAEVIVYLSVYRTYVREDEAAVNASDVQVIERAVSHARRRNPLINASLFDFIESVLLHRDPPGLDDQARAMRRAFGTHFQQLTGPVFAKGVEDTAFYRYLPLLAANEVGCDPTRLGTTAEVAHATLAARAAQMPHTLSATATHDTKRGEDARARLYVLSEIADRWAATADLWWRMNAGFKQTVDGVTVPSDAEEYLLYQTLVGVWPLPGQPGDETLARRVGDYMMKARREAKLFTSYVNPNPRYEEAAAAFVQAVLDPARNRTFASEVGAFVGDIAHAGVWNSLTQLTLKLSAPGVPDFFQGRESWDFSLVDPDNRGPVDFAAHAATLNHAFAEFETRGPAAVEAWFREPADGRIKAWLTATGLRLRQAHQALFQGSDYQPLVCQGPGAPYVFAFARRTSSEAVVTVVGRHLTTMGAQLPVGEAWAGTSVVLPDDGLAGGSLRDAFTGRRVRVAQNRLPLESVFASLPVALLETAS